MRKLIIFLLILPAMAWGQEGFNTKLSLGIQLTSDLYQAHLNKTHFSGTTIKTQEGISSKLNYAGGVVLKYQVAPRVKLRSGLMIASRRYSNWVSQEIKPTTDNTQMRMGTFVNQMKLTVLQIPVTVQYDIQFGKFTCFFSGGLSYNKSIKSENYKQMTIRELGTSYASFQTRENDDPVIIQNISALGGFGLDYQVSDRVFLSVEPFYQLDLTRRDLFLANGRFYSYGISTGIYYNFN